MTISAYTKSAIKFAKDSADWSGMDPYVFYSTSVTDSWAETCDNAHGGLLLDWAFHLSEDEIRARAPQQMLDQLASMLDQVIDEGCDAEQLGAILELMN